MPEFDISTPRNPNCVVRVDDCDAYLFEGVKWSPDRRPCGLVYAHRKPKGRGKVYLHRLIMQPEPGLYIDHIDRNGLNNTRANLRIVGAKVNAWNSRATGESAFKGVYPKRARWAASIKEQATPYNLGVFDTEEEAAVAYDAAALALGRDRTGLNFPDRDTPPRLLPSYFKPNDWGAPGVRRMPAGRFGARVTINGKRFSIGTFETAEEASAEVWRLKERKQGDAA